VELHRAFLALGVLFLLGLVADSLGRRVHIPRVTLLMLLGIAVGGSGLDLIPAEIEASFDFLVTAALSMVAFVLGGHLSRANLRLHGREIIWISITVVVVTAIAVSLSLMVIGVPAHLALLLGAIATATAPAAMHDVVKQTGAKGAFAERLMGIVAVDDGWGLIVFGVILVLAKALIGETASDVTLLIAWEIGGSLLVGLLVGIPAALLTGRLRPGQPMQIEALGVVFICAGFAIWLDVSYLLAGMVAGTVVANFARHHERPFHEIENIQLPFLILFFLLAGASLDVSALNGLGVIGVFYIALRLAGRVLGSWIGGRWAGIGTRESLLTGLALTPQAGVAVGMGLVAADQFPESRETILGLVVATTIVFEIFGPALTRYALIKQPAKIDGPSSSSD